jgi:proteasome lid subunit RPN8/RPN11
MTPDRLRLTAAQRAAMVAHVQRSLPNEACGLLGGLPGQVERVYCLENVYHSPVAYLMDPAMQVEAMIEIEAKGWEVTGIFHSHPAGPPVPSATDVAQALYPDSVYVIFSPDGAGGWQMRGFEIAEHRVREVALDIRE